MWEKNELYTIGKLSKAVNISTDTLRYYDEIGLLKPAHIDKFSGYRYYTLNQAADLNHIIEFKEYGFSLNEIKEMLNCTPLANIYRKRYNTLLLEKLRLDGIITKLSIKIKQQEETVMKKNVLLVDDAAFMRMMCKDVFNKGGYEVVGEAENGEEGIERYKELTPDLVILDILMPLMDGIQALRKIKSHNPNAAVVMLSASGQLAMVTEALRSGARRFVVKPFNSDTLLKAAKEALEDTAPFNLEVLNLLSTTEQNSGMSVLSQTSIDELTLIAQGETAKAASLAKQFKAVAHMEEKVEPNEQNETNKLLRKIIQGQEDIKTLLINNLKKSV